MEVVVGVLISALGLYVGIFNQTWILAGFNEKKVKNKNLLAKIAGFAMIVPIGLFIIVMSFLQFDNKETIVATALIAYILLFVTYVNMKLVNNN